MKTEEQAKASDCCGPAGCGEWQGNRRLCVGSTCMGWRWQYGIMVVPAEIAEAVAAQPCLGFCGAAGRPA